MLETRSCKSIDFVILEHLLCQNTHKKVDLSRTCMSENITSKSW